MRGVRKSFRKTNAIKFNINYSIEIMLLDKYTRRIMRRIIISIKLEQFCLKPGQSLESSLTQSVTKLHWYANCEGGSWRDKRGGLTVCTIGDSISCAVTVLFRMQGNCRMKRAAFRRESSRRRASPDPPCFTRYTVIRVY